MGKWWHWLIFLSFISLIAFFTFSSQEETSGLQVIASDTQSSLFLDGQYLDKTPFINKNIRPGSYLLRIEPDDVKLAPYETQVLLSKNSLTVVSWEPSDRPESSSGLVYELESIKNKNGELSFITIPDNAAIKVGNNAAQFSPVTIKDVEPKVHQFEISLLGYKAQQHQVNVIKGQRITITAKLAKSIPPALKE